MSVRQRGKNTVCVLNFNIEGQYYTFTLNGKKGMPLITSKREARDYEAELKRQIKTGRFLADTELKNFGKFFNEIYLDYSKQHKSKLANEFDEYHGEMLLKAFGNKNLNQITPKMIEDYLTKLLAKKTRFNKPFSPVTIRRQYNMLNHIYNMAIRERIYYDNPCRYVSKKAIEKLPTWIQRDRWLNKYPPIEVEDEDGNKKLVSEEERLFGAFTEHGEHLVAIGRIVLNTGIRPPKEVLEIKKEHVNLSDQARYCKVEQVDVLIPPQAVLVAKGKDGKPRVVPLNQSAGEVFKTLIDNEASDEWLFANKDGQPIKEVKKGWREACIRAGISDLRLYDLRHTFATRLLERGVHQYIISSLLGHSKSSLGFGASRITPGYAHVTWEIMVRAVESLEYPVPSLESVFGSRLGKILANAENDVLEAKAVNA